jgi:hypothetical protein
MTKEEKAKYQKFATFCMREKQTVLFNGHKYRAEKMCFGFDPNGHEYIVVELADLNGCDSLITVGLQEFYNENHKEESKSEQTSKM